MEIIAKNLSYSNEYKALVAIGSSVEIFKPADNTITIENEEVVPWGVDNNLPQLVMDKIDSSEVVGSNLFFNNSTAYGLGIKPLMKEVENGVVVGYKECTDQRVLDFFENNDLDGYFLEQISDMMTFFNVFPEIIISNDGSQIVSLRHKEAAFSRWGSIAKGESEITKHYYFADWATKNPSKEEVVITPVLSRYYTLERLKEAVSTTKNRRFMLQISMPTPGRTYYANPYWWSIFKSGWFDLSVMIPLFKKALLKNHLAVRYIIYVSDAYWEEQCTIRGITKTDPDGFKKLQQEVGETLTKFLSENEKGGGMIASKKIYPGANGKANEDKYIEIVPIKPEIEGGEFIEDSEEAGNIISYAMGVHPSLNGSVPGKTSGSLGGSDKRELFMIKQSLMSPFRDRLLKPLQLIKKYNGWPDNLVFGIPEYQFPTLDIAKSGKIEKNQNPK